MNSVKLFAQLK